MDHSRDPCPWVALSDFGGAFSMGALGGEGHRLILSWLVSDRFAGTLWHGIKGFRNSPYGERRIGMITAIKARAPVTGGNFGVWGGMFSTFDCAVKGIRKKEDPYNSIIAGFFTGGALAIRGGYKAARNGAIMCAIFLAVIEGVGIGIQRLMAENTRLDVRLGSIGDVQIMLTKICSFPLPQHRPHLLQEQWRRDWRWLPLHISFRSSSGMRSPSVSS